MNEALLKLVEIFQEKSPDLWRIAMAQVDVGIFQCKIWAGIFIVAFSVSLLFAIMFSRNDDKYIVCASACISVMSLIFLLERIASMISMSMNPEYYAIQYLIELVK